METWIKVCLAILLPILILAALFNLGYVSDLRLQWPIVFATDDTNDGRNEEDYGDRSTESRGAGGGRDGQGYCDRMHGPGRTIFKGWTEKNGQRGALCPAADGGSSSVATGPTPADTPPPSSRGHCAYGDDSCGQEYCDRVHGPGRTFKGWTVKNGQKGALCPKA